MIFRNHTNNIYYQCWKQMCCLIFYLFIWELLIFFQDSLMNKQHLFKIEIFFFFINVTYSWQIKVSFKIEYVWISFKKKKEKEKHVLTPNFWKVHKIFVTFPRILKKIRESKKSISIYFIYIYIYLYKHISHPLKVFFEVLPSGRRFRSIKCSSNRYKCIYIYLF